MAIPLVGAMTLCVLSGPLLTHSVEQNVQVCDPVKQKVMLCVPGERPHSGAAVCQVVPHAGAACIAAPVGAAAECRVLGAPQVIVLSQAAKPEGGQGAIALQMLPSQSQWIGVRLTPVPAPLAAHVGSDGMMIANIVKGSPADQSGLERYDVVIAFADRKIKDMQNLVDAIGEVKAGTRTEIVVVRGGKKETRTITPTERPAADKWEYKYEEPVEDSVDQSLKLRGTRLLKDPTGAWIFEDLGPMRQIPDVLKELDKLDLKHWGGQVIPEDSDLDIEIMTKPDDKDVKARIEIRVQVDQDGKVTTIRRDADEKIHVERVAPDGTKSSNTYENLDEFQKQDPESYELFPHLSGLRLYRAMRPRAEQLDKLQKRFQVEVETKLKDALEHSKQAQEHAEKAAEKAREHYQTIIKKHAVEGPAGPTGSLSVSVGDDGKISVTTYKGGRRTMYQFDSKEEFKKSEPELYEKVKSLFE